MVTKSWLVTLAPLVIALAETLKAFLSGESLTDQEIELIKYLVGTFVTSGAIGAYLSARRPKTA